MKKLILSTLGTIWFLWVLALFIFHIGTLQPPKVDVSQLSGEAQWFPKTAEHQIQNLFLSGDPYTRGLKAGQLTHTLLFQQEQELFALFEKIFPSRWIAYGFELGLIPIFKGIEDVIPKEYLLEMYGVSRSTEKDYDIYAEAYTRQLAYHGLHEVGQMMVDQVQDDRLEGMACTAIVAPIGKSWLVGRNFDFEGSKTLDEDKILKWVYPPQGNAYVSVIWAGMVGAVTAVNDKGLYLSINAANSEKFDRHGWPSTLLVTKIMESASTADEAIALFNNTPIMITDVFLLVDSAAGKAYRIEKSPTHTAVIPLSEASSLTNHLQDPYWETDTVNQFRHFNLTSQFRADRANQLLQKLKESRTPDWEMSFLSILRDKMGLDETPLSLGNRRAINALIANHGVIFNGETQTLYVSRGPHLNNAFEGFNLKESFLNKKPIYTRTLPADSEISPDQFHSFVNYKFILDLAKKALKQNNKDSFLNSIKEAEALILKDPRLEDALFNSLQADYFLQQRDVRQAKVFAQKALDLKPAYKKDQQHLEDVLK